MLRVFLSTNGNVDVNFRKKTFKLKIEYRKTSFLIPGTKTEKPKLGFEIFAKLNIFNIKIFYFISIWIRISNRKTDLIGCKCILFLKLFIYSDGM